MSVNEDDEKRQRKISVSSLEKRRMTRRMSRTTFLSTGGSITESLPKKPIRLENTYRMEPNAEEKFNGAKVKRTVQEVLESYLRDKSYKNNSTDSLKQLADIVKHEIKDVVGSRYKIVCWISWADRASQSIQAGSKCLWDPKTDNFVSETFMINNLFVHATVFASYYE